MSINAAKVVLGGIAAGVVMLVIGFVVQGLLLGPRVEAEMVAAAPSLQGRGIGTGTMVARIATQLIIGILLVWLYAAMRPRFGPGIRTAALAAFVVWLCGFIFYMDWLYMGMMTLATYGIVSAVMLITLLIAAAVGGMIYTEGGRTAA